MFQKEFFILQLFSKRLAFLFCAIVVIASTVFFAHSSQCLAQGLLQRAAAQKKTDDGENTKNNKTEKKDNKSNIPWAELDSRATKLVKDVVDDNTFSRRMPTQTTHCDGEMYLFLLNHPDVVVAIWEELGITQISLKETGTNTFDLQEGTGTTGEVEILYCGKNVAVLYAKGSYTAPMVPRKVNGEAVLVLTTRYGKDRSNRQVIQANLDTYVKIHNPGAQMLAKVMIPVVGKVADGNFEHVVEFASGLSEASENDYEAVQSLANRLTGIRAEVATAFSVIAEKVYDREIERYLAIANHEANAKRTLVDQTNSQTSAQINIDTNHQQLASHQQQSVTVHTINNAIGEHVDHRVQAPNRLPSVELSDVLSQRPVGREYAQPYPAYGDYKEESPVSVVRETNALPNVSTQSQQQLPPAQTYKADFNDSDAFFAELSQNNIHSQNHDTSDKTPDQALTTNVAAPTSSPRSELVLPAQNVAGVPNYTPTRNTASTIPIPMLPKQEEWSAQSVNKASNANQSNARTVTIVNDGRTINYQMNADLVRQLQSQNQSQTQATQTLQQLPIQQRANALLPQQERLQPDVEAEQITNMNTEPARKVIIGTIRANSNLPMPISPYDDSEPNTGIVLPPVTTSSPSQPTNIDLPPLRSGNSTQPANTTTAIPLSQAVAPGTQVIASPVTQQIPTAAPSRVKPPQFRSNP